MQTESTFDQKTLQSAPSFGRPKRLRWLRAIMRGLAITLLALMLLALLYQWIGTAIDARRYPPPGQLVDVGGHAMHIHCMGEGSPTVVLDTLSGGVSAYWAWVQPDIVRTTRVCVYDRAGRAWSSATPSVHVDQGVEKLHSLLTNAGEQGPYVLVGHSIGGLYALLFAHTYPQETAGVVLIDSSHPDQHSRYPELIESDKAALGMMQMATWAARLGVARLYFDLGGKLDMGDLPPQAFAEASAWGSRADHFQSIVEEIQLAEANFDYAHTTLGDLGALPLAVVSADTVTTANGDMFAKWSDLQADLVTLSTHSVHISVPDSNHTSLVFHPDHAVVTAQAILDVVDTVRTEGKLAR
jgi:pimeloyl-ACP methyl ester carboxylesterase